MYRVLEAFLLNATLIFTLIIIRRQSCYNMCLKRPFRFNAKKYTKLSSNFKFCQNIWTVKPPKILLIYPKCRGYSFLIHWQLYLTRWVINYLSTPDNSQHHRHHHHLFNRKKLINVSWKPVSSCSTVSRQCVEFSDFFSSRFRVVNIGDHASSEPSVFSHLD